MDTFGAVVEEECNGQWSFASKVGSSPLGQLASRLRSELGHEKVASPRGVLRCDLPYTTKEDEQDEEVVRTEGGSTFSLAKFHERFGERCRRQEPPDSRRSRPGGGSVDAQTRQGDIAAGQGRLGAAAHADLEFLSNLFKHRDSNRMRRTVLPIASLIRAGENEKAQELFTLARDGLVSLARESWSLLQGRHPEAELRLGPPRWEQDQQLPRQSSSSSQSSASRQNYDMDLESCGGATISTMDCSLGRPSAATSTASSPGMLISSLPPADCAWSASSDTGGLVTEGDAFNEEVNRSWTGTVYGHRDDWELQYMIGFAFDEVYHRLHSSNDRCGESVALEAVGLLDTARERVLEWTVKRWYSCYEKPDLE